MGIRDGELRPGRSRKLGWSPESSTDVSGVSGSDRETDADEGGADLLLERLSEIEDGVEGDVMVVG